MLRSIFFVARGLLIAALLSNYTLAQTAQDEAKLKQLKQQITAIQRILEEKDAAKDSLQRELREVELRAADLYTKSVFLEKQIKQSQVQITSLSRERSKLEQQTLVQREALLLQLQTAYRMGREQPLKLLLNQQHPERMMRMVKYYSYVVNHRVEKISDYLLSMRSLGETAAKLSLQKQALQSDKEKLDQQQIDLSNAKAQRQKTLQQLSLRIRSDREKIGLLEKERAQLETLITEVQEAITKLAPPKDYKPFAKQKGQFNWPVEGAVQHAFGSVRTGQVRWNGWLIAANQGDPVKAVHYGQVVFSDYLRGLGLLIIVDHGDGYMTLYAHNQRLSKSIGEWVKPGDEIATAGNSGGMSENALYFEIRKDGRPVDPRSWLKRRG